MGVISKSKKYIIKIFSLFFVAVLCLSMIPCIDAFAKNNGKGNGNGNTNTSECVLLTGQELNSKMLNLGGTEEATIHDGSTVQQNTTIKSIKRATTRSGGSSVNISQSSSKPVYMWLEGDTLYWYSDTVNPIMNADSKQLFANMVGLEDISGVADWDASRVTSTYFMFSRCFHLTDLHGVENWNMASLTDMTDTFFRYYEDDDPLYKMTNLDAMANWDVSHVTSMNSVFYGLQYITSLEALKNWDTGNVKDMSYAFMHLHNLETLEGLENWNVSSVTNMYNCFSHLHKVTDISAIANWDVSSVYNMGGAMRSCRALSDISPVANWNTKNVTIMGGSTYWGGTFSYDDNVTDFSPLKNWNTEKVRDMRCLFQGCAKMTDVTPFSNWNVSSVEQFDAMFSGASKIEDASSLSRWIIGGNATYNNIFGTNKNLASNPSLYPEWYPDYVAPPKEEYENIVVPSIKTEFDKKRHEIEVTGLEDGQTIQYRLASSEGSFTSHTPKMFGIGKGEWEYQVLEDGTIIKEGTVSIEITEPEDTGDLKFKTLEFIEGEDFEDSGIKSYRFESDQHQINPYGTEYFYNQLTDDGKAFWDALYVDCQSVLEAKTNMSPIGSSGYLLVADAPCGSLSDEEAYAITTMFDVAHPQFWFLTGTHAFRAYKDGSQDMVLLSYADIASASTRQAMRQEINTKFESMLAEINQQSTDADKVKKADELICKAVDYETNDYDQGIYSAFVTGKSVCAGYAESMEMLLNAAGVETMCITSSAHEWNQVKINGTWRLLDTTWDDEGDNSNKLFLGICENHYLVTSDSNHTPSEQWETYNRPECHLWGNGTGICKTCGTHLSECNTVYDATVDIDNKRPAVGDTITANISFDSGNQRYVWCNSNGAIKGENGTTYTVRKEDAGKHIRVYVYDDKMTGGYATIRTTAPVGKLAISGVSLDIPRPVYGDTVTAVTVPEDAEATYQWYNSDGIIEGATDKSYTPTAEDVMKHLRVYVKGANGYTGTVTVRTTAPVQREAITSVSLDIPRPTYGDTITAVTVPEDANATYQWYNSDGKIEGATGKTYTPTADDVMKHLRVYVKGSGTHSGSVTVRTTAPVQRAVITGVSLDIPRPTYGDTITAVTVPEDASATYQWYNSDGKIEGATGKSYTPTQEDIMKHLRVYVKGSGAYTGSVTVRTTAPVQRQ